MPGFRRRLGHAMASRDLGATPRRINPAAGGHSETPPRSRFHQDSHMVVIRLARGGANKRPFYNIVAADSSRRRDGRFIERLGFYNPMAAGGEQPLRLALDRITYWSSVGAQLSPTVKRLVSQAQKQT